VLREDLHDRFVDKPVSYWELHRKFDVFTRKIEAFKYGDKLKIRVNFAVAVPAELVFDSLEEFGTKVHNIC
jgi:hypothetical protein